MVLFVIPQSAACVSSRFLKKQKNKTVECLMDFSFSASQKAGNTYYCWAAQVNGNCHAVGPSILTFCPAFYCDAAVICGMKPEICHFLAASASPKRLVPSHLPTPRKKKKSRCASFEQDVLPLTSL